MRAYELQTDANNFQAYVIPESEDLDLLDDLFGKPNRGRWRPIRLESERATKPPRPRGDFPCNFLGGMMPALSQRAVDVLRDLLEPVGEILPVACDAEPLWLYNCTRFADVLDEPACEVRRYSDGALAQIYRHAWRPEVDRETCFRIPQRRRSSVYVTDIVVERIRCAGLVGYELRE